MFRNLIGLMLGATLLAALVGAGVSNAQNSNPMGVSLECWSGTAYVPCTQTGGMTVTAAPYPFKWLGDIKASTSIASATTLASLAPAGATYVAFMAVTGTLYYTIDGSTPSSSNYDGSLAAGSSVSFPGADTIGRMKIIGTNVAGNFWR